MATLMPLIMQGEGALNLIHPSLYLVFEGVIRFTRKFVLPVIA